MPLFFSRACLALASLLPLAAFAATPTLSGEARGLTTVNVTHAGPTWTIAGRHQTVTLDAATLALRVQAGPTAWSMVPSTLTDLRVKDRDGEFSARLADAAQIAIVPYDAGFKTGVKLTLSGWRRNAAAPVVPLTLYLTVALEGADEELVCDVAADESAGAVVCELNWPTALDARTVDWTLLPNGRGNLLPRDWPKEFYPIRRNTKDGTVDPTDHSVLQSHVIECWSMSWWGFQQGKSAMMVIVDTPDDAAYQFSHPAGGPTAIGPRWLSTLGRLGYVRSARLCFFSEGNYVTLAKRYRRYVQESGLFVSLREKIARTPLVAELIGSSQTRVSILHNQSTDSDRYDPATHYTLNTFDEQAQRLRALKARGVDRTLVMVSGWPNLGYDRQHPDPLPPPEAAGGWAGLKRLADTCRELGYPCTFHDQYRDYYADAPSYDPQFAIHEEDDSLPPKAFAGSRFGDWKEGRIPFMRHWDGGKQTYLNARYQLGHLEKNYAQFFAHDIRPQGIYLDVIGYVTPDEDYNPEHPTTRGDAMRGQIALLNWSRQHLGCTVTESGSDWVVPYTDCVNQSGGVGKCVPVPLYNLVYHDAVFITHGASGSAGIKGLFTGLLCGGLPELPATRQAGDERSLELIQQMAALHRRVALLEMTNHEFLDAARTKERTTFADGTTVTVDWTAQSVAISPELK